MKVAVLGVGRIGTLHARLLASQPGVELIVADVDATHAAHAAELTGGRAAASIDEALAAADAVVVAATTDAHAPLTRAAVDRGLPVFCEKPLALDLQETRDLVGHVEGKGGVVQVGFQRRFDPAYVEARRRVESGEIGTVYLVRLIAHDHEPPPPTYIPVSGGLWRDSSIHDFDALRWLLGQEVDEIYADGSDGGVPVFAENQDVFSGAAILRTTGGTMAVLGQTRHDPLGYDIRMEVIGSRDSVAVGLSPRTPIRSLEPDAPTGPTEPWDSFLTRFETAYGNELVEFLRVARGEVPSPCTVRDGLEAMRISVAAGRSRVEHRPVRLSEV